MDTNITPALIPEAPLVTVTVAVTVGPLTTVRVFCKVTVAVTPFLAAGMIVPGEGSELVVVLIPVALAVLHKLL